MRSRCQESGQGLVEFAIVLPLLVLLIFALFDAGRAVIFYSELTNAARVGARVAMVNQSDDATCVSGERTFKCAVAELTVALGITPESIQDLTISGSDCALLGNCSATVTLTHPFVPVTPVISDLIGPFGFTASATMQIERQYANP